MGDGKFVFEGKVCDFSGVGRFVLGLAGEIEVEYPGEFKEYLKEKIKRHNF